MDGDQFAFALASSPWLCGLGLLASAAMIGCVIWFHDEGCRCGRCRRRASDAKGGR